MNNPKGGKENETNLVCSSIDFIDGRFNLRRHPDLCLGSQTGRPELDKGQATVTNITPGSHSFVARSFDGTWESGDSNVVVTGPVPNPPGNFKILTVVLASVGAFAVILLAIFRKK
jgi:hypothetical protein